MSALFATDVIANLNHETPFFLFSKNRIVERLNAFNQCFPGEAIHYAMKANSESDVLQTVFDAGAGFEVASVHELMLLMDMGVPPERIIYGTSVKPAPHINAFFDYGVDRFAFDCPHELDKIAAAAPGARVYVRVRVDDAGSVFRFSEKFGAERESIVPLLQHAQRLGLQPYGISFHVGSQASNLHSWASAIEGLAPILGQLATVGIRIEVINLGGGFPCSYVSAEPVPALPEIAASALRQYRRLPYHPKMILEPGRGIVGDTAVLVASVIARVERKGATWLFMDAGVYNALYEALPFQGSTQYKVTNLHLPCESGQSFFAIAGPTGDSRDIITRGALLARSTAVGDKLVFHSVGAYSLVVTSRFNGFPKPNVYFHDDRCERMGKAPVSSFHTVVSA